MSVCLRPRVRAVSVGTTLLVFAWATAQLEARGPCQQGMMGGGSFGIPGGMMGRSMMGPMGPQQAMMSGMGPGMGAMGQGMGAMAPGMGAMGQGMAGMGQPPGSTGDSRLNLNDPAAVLAHQDELGLAKEQVQRLEKMRSAGRKQAAHLLTKDQKEKMKAIAGAMKTSGQTPAKATPAPEGKSRKSSSASR